ncbi:MAG: double-strand break repair helicase AddA [Sphingomonadaceae bacterium]
MAGARSVKGRIYSLKGAQMGAVAPQDSVWLSASAGTGKTQVLSARVLRLLLMEETRPEQILCLTFTKAGAAEMATRVNDVLARWVRMKPDELAIDLAAIGASVDAKTQARARSLFASVLDCPGGGLRIDTIHAFSQWLLAAFPEEAGLQPGTRAMEDRDRDLLAQQVLADLVSNLAETNNIPMLGTLSDLSLSQSPDGVRNWLMRCADARDMWYGPASWQPPMKGRTRQLLGLPPDADLNWLASLCSSPQFDEIPLHTCLSGYQLWKGKTGKEVAGLIQQWLAASAADRLDALPTLHKAMFTQKGTGKLPKNAAEDFLEASEAVHRSFEQIKAMQFLVGFAEDLAPALELGRLFALAWDDAKAREGFIDFDDQIRVAARLLTRSDISDWIRFKLDRRFDHILVDEAQDTNASQWSIIKALTGDFFTGLGQHEDKIRTIFVVGDYKQAIFGFQGTSPENFRIAQEQFSQLMADAADNAVKSRGSVTRRELLELDLGRSYRTSQTVLDFVNQALDLIGPEAIGLDRQVDRHIGLDIPGQVTLWNPVQPGNDSEDSEGQNDSGQNDSGQNDLGQNDDWLPAPERTMADRIASQIKQWLDHGFILTKSGTAQRATPGDIMVLVRKRSALAALIVARLYAAGVPVAGVDRLRLGAPLVVKDLMTVARFCVQPLDDLNLANFLVSPLGGWTQEDLLEHAFREPLSIGQKRQPPVALWRHLQSSKSPLVLETIARLREVLNLADYDTPGALLHWILVGPWNGRRALVARLGSEANDAIDELLNAAHAYTSSHTSSLQGFIKWFDANNGELKRDLGTHANEVRVMTVHGSKGLESPIVILADATGNPAKSKSRDLTLAENDDLRSVSSVETRVPVLPVSKSVMTGRLLQSAEAAKEEDMREHWRLLYVAMTRAEEALFIGGALGKKETTPADESWYGMLSPLFDGDTLEDEIWGGSKSIGIEAGQTMPAIKHGQSAGIIMPESGNGYESLPEWACTPIAREPRPPRPLAPSSAGQDHSAYPPARSEQAMEAARRGTLIHSLLERLPEIPPDERAGAGAEWLRNRSDDLPSDVRNSLLQSVLEVLDDPQFSAVFAPGSLAEVPLASVVDGQVIAGTVDRLLVTDSEVRVVDFKTNQRVPATIQDIPEANIRQMAVYSAALQVIYPDRRIYAALLYTAAPVLMEIPAEELTRRKPALSHGE